MISRQIDKQIILLNYEPARLACWATTGSVRAPSLSCSKIVIGNLHLSSFFLTDLKLSDERFRKKWEVFEILGRVLLGVVVSKLRLGGKLDF